MKMSASNCYWPLGYQTLECLFALFTGCRMDQHGQGLDLLYDVQLRIIGSAILGASLAAYLLRVRLLAPSSIACTGPRYLVCVMGSKARCPLKLPYGC